jgi:hypothetical protein
MDKTQHLAETVPVLLRTSQINSTDLWAKHTGLFWSTGHQVVGPDRPGAGWYTHGTLATTAYV